ncbi:MAG: S-layer homology domain-containing protein [Clostridia bacterium]|nr:S-layer homology domain-containing protein [Clostridia bacterium]
MERKTFKKVFISESLKIILSVLTLAMLLTSVMLASFFKNVKAGNNPDSPKHVVKTIIYGDSLGGSINPNGEKIVTDGSTFVLTLRSGDKNVANKVEVKVYVMNEDHSAYEHNENLSGVVNLNKKSTFNIPNVNSDMSIEVTFGFDESFVENPSSGASVTIGDDLLDGEGQLIKMHKAYMTGYSDKTFRPQNFVIREEVAAIVARLHSEFNLDDNYAESNTFTDTDTRWSKNYIGFCKYKNLINGYEDGSFKPTKNMTRAELAVLVNNFLRIQNAEVSEEELSKTIFYDAKGRWYEKEVNKLAILGILNGYKDGTFKGDAFVTRAEVINVMNKVNGRTVKGDIPKEYQDKVTSAFKDVDSTRWFFKDVAEAGIDHPADLY